MTGLLFSLWVGASALAAPRPLSVAPGQSALVFALSAVNEEVATQAVNKVQVSLSDFAGVMPSFPRAAVVVHFFDATKPASDLKVLNRIQRKYASRGVQVLALAERAPSLGALADQVGALKLDFPVLRDVDQVVMGRYGVSELPLTLVIEGNGNLFAIGQPQGESMEKGIEAEITPLLKR